MTQKRAIGFDFGGVIGGDPDIGHDFTHRGAELQGVTTEEWRRVYFAHNHLINTGAKSKRDFWEHFLREFDQTDKLEQVLALDQAMAAKYMGINQEVIAISDELRSRGHKVGLLSNATAEVARVIKGLGVERHFDTFVFSAEIGLQKPDVAAFQHLATVLEVDIHDLIFIDDTKVSLQTAAQAGFTPILFKSAEQLRGELKDLKLLAPIS